MSLVFPGKMPHHASCWEASVKMRGQQRLSPSGVSDLVRACDWQLLRGMTRYFTSVWCPDCHPFLPTLAIVILPISRNPTAANANVRPLWSYSAMQHTLHKKWEVDQGHCIGNATSPMFIIPDLTFWTSNWTTSYSVVHTRSENKSNTHGVFSTFFFSFSLQFIYYLLCSKPWAFLQWW